MYFALQKNCELSGHFSEEVAQTRLREAVMRRDALTLWADSSSSRPA